LGVKIITAINTDNFCFYYDSMVRCEWKIEISCSYNDGCVFLYIYYDCCMTELYKMYMSREHPKKTWWEYVKIRRALTYPEKML